MPHFRPVFLFLWLANIVVRPLVFFWLNHERHDYHLPFDYLSGLSFFNVYNGSTQSTDLIRGWVDGGKQNLSHRLNRLNQVKHTLAGIPEYCGKKWNNNTSLMTRLFLVAIGRWKITRRNEKKRNMNERKRMEGKKQHVRCPLFFNFFRFFYYYIIYLFFFNTGKKPC